ncbi:MULTISPECIES: GNAT family N-acetyltransferase [Rhodanobacter]|uniref:Sortase-like acyltransferase n=1 Tax=Rhodanobacter denitrificans TaxID=666685 RepID=M4NGD1_9GAMM|nr:MULTISPECIES: GNAT family N-acetyltransferase [Rhodanobacter]AGG89954.1 sortase-like acyltransferase [Rhodanobacter denitrificans]KZC20906.1 GNAT family acetyltransferase [Rhodanobacter denitrificans]UJM85350.1 GNAT family N-acetyltransferase [Rhodanobacter denitrificans]UJM92786.1 GNAT family N-acetyltransferase [Rhodanobacter denitrificans]UJM96316.1 GNAT family N-acetyltransferase [Rhodanobacter denitrificans]
MSNIHHTEPTPTPAAPFGAIEGTHWIETLNDGSPVLVRPLRAEDRQRETEFIDRLSEQACRFRFLGNLKEASPALLDQLMNVDYHDRMAFVALAHDNGELRLVGVSRYGASGDDKQCECAVTVADDWRHRGLGVLLMRRLIEIARKNGFRRMFSIDATENEPMRELAGFLGFQRRIDPDDATQVIHSLDL